MRAKFMIFSLNYHILELFSSSNVHTVGVHV